MEGLGIAANIIAVVDLTANACGLFYKYAKSANNCSKSVEKLEQELLTVQKTLCGLRDISGRLDAACQGGLPPVISQLSTALKDCEYTLGALIREMGGRRRNKFREKLHWQLKWPIKEPEIMNFISRLGRYQQTFQQALQADIA
jgi:hypothetical protein